MKPTKEEAALREHVRPYLYNQEIRPTFALITALIHAVREDCAKVAEKYPYGTKDFCDGIAAAIREGRKG